MDSTFNVTEWVLKNTIKEGKKENTYKFIEYVVNNLFPLNEYSNKELTSLMNKFKEEADDYNITIDKEIEEKIINLKNQLEYTNDDESKAKIKEKIKALELQLDNQLEKYIQRFDQLKNSSKITEKDLRTYSLAKLLKIVQSSEGVDAPEEETGPDVIYSENGYTIYSGGNEELCQRHRGEVPWCITRTSFGNYRYSATRNYPSFYLVKNTNLPDNDPLSFVAIQVRANGKYVYTNRRNSPNESNEMSWESLNREISWLQNIPNVKNLLTYVPLSSKEKLTQLYSKESISIRDWEKFPFNEKKQYIVIRKDRNELFDDVSRNTFVQNYLPNYPQLATFIATNADLMDADILLRNLGNFSPNDAKSITANLRELIKVKELKRGVFPFDVKKLLVRLNKFEILSNQRLYVTKDGGAIVQLIFDGKDMKVNVFTEERDYSNIKLNQRTAKFILDYPEIDKLPIPTILNLLEKEVVDTDFLNKILEKASTDENSAIVVKDTDTGKIILDSNSFTSYKLENGKITSIPFESEEVQNILSGEESNTGFQKSAVELVYNGRSLPSFIDRNSFLNILNNTPYSKRIGIARDKNGVILVNTSPDAQPPIFVTQATMPEDGIPTSIIDYGRNGASEDWRIYDYNNALLVQEYALVVKYYRETNQPFNDNQIKNFLKGDSDRAIAAIRANPLMAQDSTLKPVVLGNQAILLNTRDPKSSFIISDRSGKLLNKVISSAQTRAILGVAAQAAPTGQAAPAAGAPRRGRPAGGAAQPAAPAAPQEGALDTGAIFAQYNLRQGWQNLSPSLQRALGSSIGIPPFRSRGASRRNNMLGNRGRVVRVLEAGRNSIYIIRLANQSHVASINTQPGNGHWVVNPNGTTLNIGSPNNLVNTLTRQGLAEELAHVVVSEFLVQNPTMLDEAKNALRLISKNKKS